MSDRVPIACSLDKGEARNRWREWNSIVGRRLRVDWSLERLVVRFPGDGVTAAKLRDLVAAEKQCCGFVAWELGELGDEMLLTISGDHELVTAMAESFGIHT